MPRRLVLLGLLCLLAGLWGQTARAEEVPQAVLDRLAAELQSLRLSRLPPAQIRVLPAASGYRALAGPYVFQISGDGAYSVRSYLLREAEGVELDEAAVAELRKTALAALDEADMIVFAPESGPARYTLTIFADVTCPFSATLHHDREFFLQEGIRLRYLAFPRQGLDSLGYKKMRPVWCGEQRAAAFTEAIEGGRVKLRECADPVEVQYWLGESLGVMGTPAIVLEDGRMLTGYSDALEILQALENPNIP